MTGKYFYLTLFSGVLLLITYFLTDYLFSKLWIFALFPIFFIGIAFLIFFILTIKRKNKSGIIAGTFIIGIILIASLLNSELFKSRKILEASLIDDLSAIHLTLRENNRFEVVASTVFTEDIFVGNYKIFENKLIFEDKRYHNDFIPDTVTIIGNKIICRFDSNGKPVTDFATYFEIRKNEFNNVP